MLAGITFDLRDYYVSLGFSQEEAAEFDSAITINAIENTLKELGFDTDRIGNVNQLIDRLAKGDRWDFIFNIAEGLYGIGREAQIPAICDAYRIPYTFSDPCVLSLTLNKELTKRIVRDLGINTPDFRLINSVKELDGLEMEFPLFAKPYAEGTSKGIDARSVIKDKAMLRKVCADLLKKFKQPVLVETYLPGREFTVGILGTGADARAIGIMEVILNEKADAGVYSYNNKENCDELVVYRLMEDETALKSAELALNAWRGIGCFDSGRVDVRCDEKGEPSFIEVNPLAGLHPEHSDLPIICNKAGIKFNDLIASILNSCLTRYGLLGKAPKKVRNVYVKGIDLEKKAVKKKSKIKVI